MKKFRIVKMRPASTSPALGLLAAAVLLPGTLLAGQSKWEKIKTPKLGNLAVPEVKRTALDNGLQLFVLEDHELPLFRLTLTLDGGGAQSPGDKLGLA